MGDGTVYGQADAVLLGSPQDIMTFDDMIGNDVICCVCSFSFLTY